MFPLDGGKQLGATQKERVGESSSCNPKRKLATETCTIKGKIARKHQKSIDVDGQRHAKRILYSVEKIEGAEEKADYLEETVESMHEDLIDFMDLQRSDGERVSTKLSDVRDIALQIQIHLRKLCEGKMIMFFFVRVSHL